MYVEIKNFEFLEQLRNILGEEELRKFLDGKNLIDCLEDVGWDIH